MPPVPKKGSLGKFFNNTGVRVTRNNLEDVLRAVYALAGAEVLVGVPEETTERPEDDDAGKAGITNAALARIHDQGAPEAHIPQREFMRPGVAAAREQIEAAMSSALKAAMRGNALVAEQAMHQAGLVTQSAIRNKIDEGIPPPLSDYTVRKRAERGRKGALLEMDNRMAGLPPSLDLAKPLVDTGEMRKSITYVIRQRKRRK